MIVVQAPDGSWQILGPDGTPIVTGAASRDEAVGALQEQVAGILGMLDEGAMPNAGARFHMWFVEGERTVDGRVIDPGATNFNRQPPLPLMVQTQNTQGHDGANLSGVIDTCQRDGNTVHTFGNFDAGSDAGCEHQRLVEEGKLTTWSPDFGDTEVTVEDAGEGEEGLGLLMPMGLMHLTAGTLLGGTGVPFPALSSARIAAIAASGAPLNLGGIEIVTADEERAIVASITAGRPDDRQVITAALVRDQLPCAECTDEGEHFGRTGGTVSNAPWNGSSSRYSDDEYKMASAACDPGDSPPKTRCFLPHHEPGGAVNRNGVHAAAARVAALKGHDAAAVAEAKRHLKSHYAKDLEEEPPDSLTASGVLVGEAGPEHIVLASGGLVDPAATARRVSEALGGMVQAEPRVEPDQPEVVVPVADVVRLPVDTLVAAGGPLHPPAEWFEDPKLDGPTRLTVTEEGRVYGHLAPWKQCHIGYPQGPKKCVLAPNSRHGYKFFLGGSVMTAEGARVRTGTLTMGSGHADELAEGIVAKAHYDGGPHCVQVADVAVGEDEFGPWFAGAIRPEVSDVELRHFTAQKLSGDWRPIEGSLELVAVCSVPVPGFPIAASGEEPQWDIEVTYHGEENGEPALVSLIASGPPAREESPDPVAVLTERVNALEATLGRVDRRTRPLISAAAERQQRRLFGH